MQSPGIHGVGKLQVSPTGHVAPLHICVVVTLHVPIPHCEAVVQLCALPEQCMPQFASVKHWVPVFMH
jgi:hypothetical protein